MILQDYLHLIFSGPDIPTTITDAVELTQESSGEVTLPSFLENQDPGFSWFQQNQDPGFSWFQQWVTGNGASPQPGQDPPEEEMSPEDDRLILPTEPTSTTTEEIQPSPTEGIQSSPTEEIQPSPTEGSTEQAGGGDYCALSASHTLCQFKVMERVKRREVLRNTNNVGNFSIHLFVKLTGPLPFMCQQDKVIRNDSGGKGCCSRQAQRAAEKVNGKQKVSKPNFALLL